MSITRRTTLSKYLIEQQRETHNLPADLRLLIEVVARACKAISYNVSKGALGDALGTAGSENVQGEVQKKLDILSNEILLDANEWGGNLAAMASEEMETFFPIPANYPRGEYLLVFDPLDGSSNIDVNVHVGMQRVARAGIGQREDERRFAFRRARREQFCAHAVSLLEFDGRRERCAAPVRRAIGHRPGRLGRHVLRPCSKCAAAQKSRRASKLL